jgi:hypothetical protein
MSDATVFVTLAFVIVWMKRKQRWKLFFQALEGTVVLGSSQAANSNPTNSSPYSGPSGQTATVQGQPVTLAQGTSVAGGGTDAIHG